MALVFCRECGKQISDLAASCPHCGAPQKTEPPKIEREVSGLWTFLFGGFYFLFKGWFKAGIAALVISLFTGLIAWFIIPFSAKKFVDSFEGK